MIILARSLIEWPAAAIAAATTPPAVLPPITPPPPAAMPPAKTQLFELTLTLESSASLPFRLRQAGAAGADVETIAGLLDRGIARGLFDGADVKLGLGQEGERGRVVERLTLVTDLGATVIVRKGDTLSVEAPRARRLSVPVRGDVYWALRAGGLSGGDAAAASDILRARAIAPDSVVNAIVTAHPGRFSRGEEQALYLAATTADGRRLRFLRWPGMPNGWIDVDRVAAAAPLGRPVSGPITSGFGVRFHPILQFFRPHQGIDFGGGFGTPVRAAADGLVEDAGWHGGYGRQVKLGHVGTIETSYSHLSSMTVSPGHRVRRGDLIGFIGASGLATGPHLHFEVRRAGKPIDPAIARLGMGEAGPSRADIARRLTELGLS